MDKQEKHDNIIETVFGLPFKVTDSEYLFFCVLREGVKHRIFPAPTAISAEWRFLTHGWVQVD